ncbi:MAG TPA: thioredoxin-disulfide reductase [Gaiellaceae bacterium]
MSENDVRNVIVIGGGPAGYTAALYSARALLNPLVIEGVTWGGQLMSTTEVENFPGYKEGVLGPQMMNDMRAQAERFGTEFVTDDAVRVDLSQRPFVVETGEGTYRAKVLIVATGATARQLGLPSETALQGKGVSYCATCDAAFFRAQKIVVVGGGDSAMEDALFLARFAEKVTIVHRRDEFRAEPIMVERARANEKIELVTSAVVDEVLGSGSGKVSGARLRSTKTDETWEIEANGVFVAIGHIPNTGLFADALEHDEAGFLITKPHSTATNVHGVFAAGDVQDPVFRQAITAAGSGCMAALEAERLLTGELHEHAAAT